MSKIVNVQLLVDEDDITRIHNGLRAILDNVSLPDQSGASNHPLILDYRIGKQTGEVDTSIERDIRDGRYELGDAFLGDGCSDLYMLVTEGDAEPFLNGPFATDVARCAAAVDYRQNKNRDDGLYRIDVPKGSKLRIEQFTGLELDPARDPVVDFILAQLDAGAEPICRLLPTGKYSKYFTVYYAGDEVVVTLDMVKAIERELKDQLVVVVRPTAEIIVTTANAAAFYPKESWVIEVRDGFVVDGYQDWMRNQVNGLRLAVGLIGELDASRTPEPVEASNLAVRAPPQSN
jgi:hypothetical protein